MQSEHIKTRGVALEKIAYGEDTYTTSPQLNTAYTQRYGDIEMAAQYTIREPKIILLSKESQKYD